MTRETQPGVQSSPGNQNSTPAEELAVLGGLLGMPTEESLETLTELARRRTWLAGACQELAKVPLEHWQAEHTRLFISGHPNTPCPPFESAYREGQMSGSAASALAALYSRVGFQVEDMPADFLGNELACASALLPMGEAAQAERTELWQHLTAWVPAFARDLRQHSEMVLYCTLGERLGELFSSEHG